MLKAIDACERLVRDATGAATVRCRVRRGVVVVELDDAALATLEAPRRAALAGEVGGRMGAAGVRRAVRFAPYRMGSAFLGAPAMPAREAVARIVPAGERRRCSDA